MTKDEAMVAVLARAPLDELRRIAEEKEAAHPTVMGLKEEMAYQIARWVKRNATPDEFAVLFSNV